MVYDSWKWKTELSEKKRQLLQYNTKKILIIILNVLILGSSVHFFIQLSL